MTLSTLISCTVYLSQKRGLMNHMFTQIYYFIATAFTVFIVRQERQWHCNGCAKVSWRDTRETHFVWAHCYRDTQREAQLYASLVLINHLATRACRTLYLTWCHYLRTIIHFFMQLLSLVISTSMLIKLTMLLLNFSSQLTVHSI